MDQGFTSQTVVCCNLAPESWKSSPALSFTQS